LASIKRLSKYLLILGLTAVPAGCSVEKNTDASRFYNSMTAKYNIYFNGYENYKAGLANIARNHKDDYADVLKVFDFSDPASASYCSADMERAILKASKLISLKSITSRPEIKDNKDISPKDKKLLDMKEYNAWVDDSYLLIAKARFYKHEYTEAASTFTYCIANANDQDIKTEAAIWQARIGNETAKYREASRILSELEITDQTPKVLRSMYFSTLADLNVKQKNYSDAIEPLTKAIELSSGKKVKIRLTFLLAQLYAKSGNAAMATKKFEKVIRMRPTYEVEFYARINIAGVFDVNSMDPARIRKELEKMLRDSKNVDFQDQIYFALGNMSMKQGKEDEAVGFFQKSAMSVSRNQNQRGRSYLALGEYFFKKPDFMKAGMYYDSTIFFLDASFPDYKAIQDRSLNLNALVSQLKIIQREDSLQNVAKMPESKRTGLINTMIAEATREETQRKATNNADRYNMGQFYENERRSQGNIQQEGKWYFYNQSALTFGRTEFRRRWGDRKLEDNWRRSNKARMATAQIGADENDQTKPDTSAAINNNKKPEFYLKNLPLNDSLMALSNDRIANAMLNAGKAYSERLTDTTRATQCYEDLIERFPKSELIPEAMFSIVRINRNLNKVKSEIYRQKILQMFPESEFARILSDPGYYEKKMAEIKLAESKYSDAYDAYTLEKFTEAIALCNEGLITYQKDQLAPKFQLLRAFCIARTSDEKSFRTELSTIIKTWPKSPEGKKAEDLINYLNQKSPELKIETEKQIAAELYKADTTVTHMFAIVIMDPAFNINQATFDVISYNIDNYTNKNYKTEGNLSINKFIIITVSGFTKYSQALDYFRNFDAEKIVRNPSGRKMITFLINSDNLKILNKEGNPERYQIFFKENYPK